jgi:hypothetical protein
MTTSTSSIVIEVWCSMSTRQFRGKVGKRTSATFVDAMTLNLLYFLKIGDWCFEDMFACNSKSSALADIPADFKDSMHFRISCVPDKKIKIAQGDL